MTTDRVRHPNGEVENAVQYAEALGWQVKRSAKGHAWGYLLCPKATREGCRIGVWSTPKNTGNHARQIRNKVDKCLCMLEAESQDSNDS